MKELRCGMCGDVMVLLAVEKCEKRPGMSVLMLECENCGTDGTPCIEYRTVREERKASQ